jgi:DNA-directed RNA polymerase subunit M/transcription elongation factor TFIIS
MERADGSNFTQNGGRDLFFHCQHCGVALVVDASAAGMTLQCQRCGKSTAAPAPGSKPARIAPEQQPERLADLQRQLKENNSQRTEISGYINQLNIQLHRWQLRLQTLETRCRELTAEIASIR